MMDALPDGTIVECVFPTPGKLQDAGIVVALVPYSTFHGLLGTPTIGYATFILLR